MYGLYELALDMDWEDLKIQAGLHGIDLEKKVQEQKKEQSGLFQDPKEYEDQTPEERQKLTDKMMNYHKQLFEGENKG